MMILSVPKLERHRPKVIKIVTITLILIFSHILPIPPKNHKLLLLLLCLMDQ